MMHGKKFILDSIRVLEMWLNFAVYLNGKSQKGAFFIIKKLLNFTVCCANYVRINHRYVQFTQFQRARFPLFLKGNHSKTKSKT